MKDSTSSNLPGGGSTGGYISGLLPPRESENKTFLAHTLGDNKLFRWLMVLLVLVQFIIFKLLYPYPDFFSDSWSYISAAQKHLNANIWPIGYSKFLWLFHEVTHSAVALIFFQYAIYQLAALYFYKTILYFYPTSKATRIILCLFLFFNPLHLYLSNYVSTDGPFVALSLVWLSELIWILQRPRMKHIIVLSVIFAIAFSFRYNAMYYPVIAAVAFYFCRKPLWFKLTGVFLGPVLIIPIVLITSHAAKEMSGVAQFPPILGGWQWANNALYIREYITIDTTQFPNAEMASLDRLARQFYEHTPPGQREPDTYVGNYYIRQKRAPLKIYMAIKYQDGSVPSWAKVAPLFDEYGKYILKKHPLGYARYFMLPNAKNYFLPPLEKLELYNLGLDNLEDVVRKWFDFEGRQAKVVSKDVQHYVLIILPTLFMVLNLYGLWVLYSFASKGRLRGISRGFISTVLLLAVLLVLNFCFSIFANIVVMRYQIFPMIVLLTFAVLLTDYLNLKFREEEQLLREKQEKQAPHAEHRLLSA
ncbi:glycosyltransferase family protein [Filimonas effusa]|uniref:Glycosyltransferase RgtA/B/C/D-like domain-containing protein n=1 Tax=Filimonas effusa TaxID=2508721 RepID=A0A4Q1D3G3_9BACT|nr:glycosyltransferase family 39 protein [Filimonas effusa]RXK82929.1 hypothetical protein ESB13_12435 [Filimonas effusa]